jgi:5-oxoprolinase (ATP-hydrolysing) subunit A
VLERVRRLLREGIVLAYDGQPLAMRPQSILVHGDTPGAVALARAIRREIEAAGGRVVPVSRLMV